MEFSVLSLNEKELWSDTLNRLPESMQDVYYTPEYYQLYEELGDGKGSCFVYKKDNSIALYPFLINSVNDLGYELDKPYYDIQGAYGYNGIVSNDYSDSFRYSFHKVFNNFCLDNNIITEFTRFHPLLNNKSFSENYVDVIFDRKTMYIDLNKSYDEIFRNFQKATRKNINKAINKYNIDVKYFEKDTRVLNTFVNIYTDTMKRLNSKPYYYFNKTYFKSLFENTNNICFIAYHDNNPISVDLTFCSNNFIHGHLSGTLINYIYMNPSSLLYSEIIKLGVSKGCRYFHAGGGATNLDRDTLLKFKLNFSKSTADFFIGRKIHNEKIYNEICEQWSIKHPQLVDDSRNIILKYRILS